MTRLITTNLAEVLYLTGRKHRIIDAEVITLPPYGIREFCVTLAGVNIDIDRYSFFVHGDPGELTRLDGVFDAIMTILRKKAESRHGGDV